jgi:hypothetical protein
MHQHLAVRQGLKSCLKTRNGRLTFVTGHKSVSASVWHDLISKFGIRKDDRLKSYEEPRKVPVR